MDLDTIIRIHPEIVIVDELAHTNVEGSLNEKRWQDVMALLDEGINVISAINIQHIESVNEEVQEYRYRSERTGTRTVFFRKRMKW